MSTGISNECGSNGKSGAASATILSSPSETATNRACAMRARTVTEFLAATEENLQNGVPFPRAVQASFRIAAANVNQVLRLDVVALVRVAFKKRSRMERLDAPNSA